MSRIGLAPIKLKQGVKVSILPDSNVYGGKTILVEGSKGKLEVELRPEVELTINESEILVSLAHNKAKGSWLKQLNSYWGLYRSLINNAVIGVSEGYKKELEIVGIGYKAEKSGNGLKLNIGYTNPIIFELPQGINAEVKDSVNIEILGIDKQLVGETAARLREMKKPEPYKGKGIKYVDEIIKRKAGKAAAA